MNRSYPMVRAALGLAGLVSMLFCASASANHNTVDYHSTGPNGGNGAFEATWGGHKEDGGRVFFVTREQMVSSDTDTRVDIYERIGATTTNLVSIGPNGGNGAFDSLYDGASADGSKVFFHTTESLVSTDTDTTNDVYQRSGGVTTILSQGPTGGNGTNDAFWVGNTPDGSRVWFVSYEQLTSGDSDGMRKDVYERSGGTTTLLSTSASNPNGSFGADFAGASQDGTHVFFYTDESMVGADSDGNNRDIYERVGGTTNLVSIGPAPGAGTNAQKAFWGGVSADGTQVFFTTTEKLTTNDTDGTCVDDLGASVPCSDVYEWSGGNTTLISTSATSPNGPYRAAYGGNTPDGSKVYFQTDEPLVSADTDGPPSAGCPDVNDLPTLHCIDVYERSGSNTTLISTSGTSPNSASTAAFTAVSQDGTRVFFSTDEQLAGTDTDSVGDIYERAGGNTFHVTAGGNGGFEAGFDAISADGSRVFFDTFETLAGNDTDGGQLDVYERVEGQTYLLSIGLTGGGGNNAAFFGGSTRDGTRVFFQTDESLTSTDTDGQQDVYSATTSYTSPIGASPLRVSLVPAFEPCETGPANATHGAPLAFPSCNAPQPSSSLVSVGPKSLGFVRMVVCDLTSSSAVCAPLTKPDIKLITSITDVRNGSPTGSDYSTPSSQDLTVVPPIQITDVYNRLNSGTNYDQSGTSAPTFPIPLSCATTLDTTVGSTCSTATSANALVPGTVLTGKRAVWQLGEVRVFDQGANGAPGDSDDKVFEAQGYFVP